MHTLAAQALMQWNNPTLFESREVYQQVRDLLCEVLGNDVAFKHLDQDQSSLLSHLVSGSIEATVNAIKRTPEHAQALIDTLESLSALAGELQAPCAVTGSH